MTLTGANNVTSDLNEAEKNVNLLTQAADAVAPALNTAGDAMLAFSDRAYLANAQMERGLTNLQNITDSTREEMERYNKDLDGVLEVTGYQISANDLLASSYDAASAGYTDTADAMSVMTSAAKLAIAGNSGLGAATDNMASSQKAVIAGMKSYSSELSEYGDAASQAAVVSDKMYKIIKLGITDISQLAPEFAEMAPLAQSVGLSMDELSGSYAAMTSAGIETNIATTNLKALLSSIARGGATEEAKGIIDALGLSFDATGLKTQGLVGILEELGSKGIDSFDEYYQLTGSTEAATALAALAAQDLGDKVKRIAEEAANLDDKVDALAGDPLGELTASTERFDRALQLAGENLAPVEATLRDLATNVLEAFNALPEPLQNIIGTMVVLGGGTAKAGGSIIQMASDIAVARIAFVQWNAQVAAATGTTGIFAVASKGASTAALGFAGSVKAATVAMAPFIATVATATAAVGSLVLAYKQYQNIQIQEKNQEILSAYQQTDQLASKTQELVSRMRSTGEALPDTEFNQWIDLLKQADGGTGVLKGQIEGLTNVQQQAKAGTLETTQELQGLSTASDEAGASMDNLGGSTEDAMAQLQAKQKADEEAAIAAEEQAESARRQEEANRALFETIERGVADSTQALEVLEQDLENMVKDGTISSQDAYQQRLQALKLYTSSVSAQYAKAMQSETLSAQQKEDLLNKQTQLVRDNQQKQLDLHREWADELRRINDEQAEIERLQLEARAYNERWTQEQLNEEMRALKAEQLEATIATIEAELAAVQDGSQKQGQLTLDLYRAKAELARNTGELVADESEKATEKLTAEAEKAKKARIDAWNKETEAFKGALANQEQAAGLTGQRINNALTFRSSFAGIQTSQLDTYTKALESQQSAKESIRDITAQISELEKESKETGEDNSQRIKELTSELEKQRDIQRLMTGELQHSSNLLSSMGIHLQGNMSYEQAALATTRLKVGIENQSLANKLEQEKISIRLKQLEQDRLILELQRQAASEAATAKEKTNLAAQIANAREQKSLLSESLKQAEKLTDFQQRANVSSARVDLASQGIDPKILGDNFKEANDRLATEVDQSFTENLRKVVDAQGQSTDTLNSSLNTQTQGILGNLEGVSKTVASSMAPVDAGVRSMAMGLDSGFGAGVAATQAQTQELAQQLRALEQATNSLPERIAQSLPRNSPATRS